MTLHNTSRYPTDEVQRLVAFAGLTPDVSVKVTDSRRHPAHGRAWDDGRVNLHVGLPRLFPASNYPAEPRVHLYDWREALVQIAAHEARHLWQWANAKPIDEDDCEQYAAGVLDAYLADWTAR